MSDEALYLPRLDIDGWNLFDEPVFMLLLLVIVEAAIAEGVLLIESLT